MLNPGDKIYIYSSSLHYPGEAIVSRVDGEYVYVKELPGIRFDYWMLELHYSVLSKIYKNIPTKLVIEDLK